MVPRDLEDLMEASRNVRRAGHEVKTLLSPGTTSVYYYNFKLCSNMKIPTLGCVESNGRPNSTPFCSVVRQLLNLAEAR